MRMLLLYLLLFSSMAFASVEEGEIGAVTTFQSWREYSVRLASRTLYRATSTSTNQRDTNLTLDYEQSNCDEGHMRVILDFGTIMEATRTFDGKGKVEVMLGQSSWGGVHDFEYSATTSAGATHAVISIGNFDWNGSSFYGALVLGTYVKLSFLINGKPDLVEFPLSGFLEANSKASADCKDLKKLLKAFGI